MSSEWGLLYAQKKECKNYLVFRSGFNRINNNFQFRGINVPEKTSSSKKLLLNYETSYSLELF